MSTFRNVTAWQKAMDLVDAIYEAVACFPQCELYALAQQMKKAAVSIPSNIAEGRGRRTTADYRNFLYHARGSAHELDTQIEIAARRRFLNADTAHVLSDKTAQVGKLINTLINATYRRDPST